MKKLKKLLVLSLLVFTLFLMLSSVNSVIAQTPEKKDITIGVSVESLDNPFFQDTVRFMKRIEKELNFKTIIISPDAREEKQITDVESLIAGGVNGIWLAPVSEAAGKQILKMCEENRVPIVVSCGSAGYLPDTWPGKYYVCHAMGEIETTLHGKPVHSFIVDGYDIATALINAGCKRLVAVVGTRGLTSADLRYEGLLLALKDHPEVKLLRTQWDCWAREPAMKAMENFLAALPSGEIDGVWAWNDGAAMGTIMAIKNAGRISEIKVVGVDATPEALAALKRGEMLTTRGGHYVLCGFGLIVLYDYLNGYEPECTTLPYSNMMMCTSKDNIDLYEKYFIKMATPYDIREMSKTTNPSSKEDYHFIQKLSLEGLEIIRNGKVERIYR